FSYDGARNLIVKKFKTFSNELGDYAENAFNQDWIDPFPKKGKRGGAFCYNLQSIKESRILSNFTGSLSDVMTLAHELGHGYHGYTLKEESILNSDYPMPLAETASIFCETIVKNAILKDASKEEKIAIIESSLQDSSQVIVDIYSRFLFESSLFDKRKEYAAAPHLCEEGGRVRPYADLRDHRPRPRGLRGRGQPSPRQPPRPPPRGRSLTSSSSVGLEGRSLSLSNSVR
ncbi:MAG: M3 family metallopeptidase, partial [Candidatus Fermentibacteraceae bacterium]